ncbi:hypothetical protein V9T40_001514 [Parthenolecanium corni]|uniref:Uncharacterized protein n=1 Tax=Parthenolecanium corni TaxID=536013 RepID=A0AAN9Y569_9HEMI
MSDINMPIDMFYDEEDEGVRKICVKIEIESKFPKLMKLRGDFSEFRDLGIEHPIHHEFGKMLESIPSRTLELLYEEVKEEMVNAAEKKMKVDKFKKSISSIRENLKKYQLLMSQRLTLIEMRFEADTKRKERVRNEEELEKLSSRFEELFGPSKLKKRLTEEKFEDAKEEIIEKSDEKPEVREDDIEILEQKEYEIERESNAVSLTKSQIEQIPEVIPDVGLELAKLIELPKEILIWTRLVNDNYRTCRVHINPQFIGNAI